MSDSDRMPLHVITDLNRELFERISKTTYSMTGIVDNPFDKFQIAIGGVAASIAISAGFFSAAHLHKFDPYDLALALIETLRAAQTPQQRLEMEQSLINMLRKRP
jgi:hypothetical protein